jgi:hypothetical protein
MALLKRPPLEGAEFFFNKLMEIPLKLIGQVSKKNSEEDIQNILKIYIPKKLQKDPFYVNWISDMAKVCGVFSDILNSDSIGFCLSTKRGCRRYHVDNVPMRLLVTYAGQGTEWLPDEAVDRSEFLNNSTNEKIIIDMSKRKFMNSWDVAIFSGGANGVLHRTPDLALNNPSVLMRLDHKSFWDSIIKIEGNNYIQSMSI